MRHRLDLARDQLRGSLWAVPGLCVLAAVALAVGLIQVDRWLDATPGFTFGAGSDGAREVLGAITTAMITFTGLVFTITIVVLQLTSSQFSPRVLRTFLRDRQTQYALGVFTATFVYAVIVLRSVRGSDPGAGDDGFVPAVSTTVALLLLLLSVALFVSYIHHIATTVQVSSIIGAIGDETRDALDGRFPAGREDPIDTGIVLPEVGMPTAVLPARRSGVVTALDVERLVRLACEADVVLRAGAHLGDFVPEGAPLVEVLGDPADLDLDAVLSAVTQRRDRSVQQDVAFGFRQLVDIAERALSTGVNDPTTAVQALDQLHDLLRRLATRPLRSGTYRDDEGRVRLVTPPERFEDYLALSLDTIEQYGADSTAVQTRVDVLLRDLEAAAVPEHRGPLQERRRGRAQRPRAA
jgi:uncharacterized membrane protein